MQGALASLGVALSPRPSSAQEPVGVPFGGAIQSDFFDGDPAYRRAFLDHCDLIMPMNELKFGLVQPERGAFDFARADELVDFALDNGRTSRGHAFVWHQTNPSWLEAIADAGEAEAVLVEHIETVADHFRGRLTSWDVVNEVIANDPMEDFGGPMRDTWWNRTLGPRHVPIAFAAAARADPAAKLVVNEYGLEFRDRSSAAKRAVMLDLVRQLQDGGVRVDAVGLQGHLYSHFQIDVDGLGRFKEELTSLGLDLIVTELDVIDFQIPGGPPEQDEAAGRVVSDFLDAVLAGRPPLAVIAWGMTDNHSWVGEQMPREDGTPSRPLPLDANYRPKPWYEDLRRRLAETI